RAGISPPSRAARARPRRSRGSRTRVGRDDSSRSCGRRRRRLDCSCSEGIMNDALRAEVAELADAHDSGSCALTGVGVRVPPSAPYENRALANLVDTYAPAVARGPARALVRTALQAIVRSGLGPFR